MFAIAIAAKIIIKLLITATFSITQQYLLVPIHIEYSAKIMLAFNPINN